MSAMTVTEFSVLLTTVGGGLVGAIRVAWKQYQNALRESADRAREQERAESYKREATRVIEDKNEDLNAASKEISAQHEDKLRLQTVIDEQRGIIDKLSTSYETLAKRQGETS